MKKCHLQASENDESFIKIDHLLYDGKRYLMYRDITQNKVRCTGTKKLRRQGARPWVSSESGSLEKIRPSIGMYRFLRWYRKCCCLSIFDASSALFCIASSKVLYFLILSNFWIEPRSEDTSQASPSTGVFNINPPHRESFIYLIASFMLFTYSPTYGTQSSP